MFKCSFNEITSKLFEKVKKRIVLAEFNLLVNQKTY